MVCMLCNTVSGTLEDRRLNLNVTGVKSLRLDLTAPNVCLLGFLCFVKYSRELGVPFTTSG